MRLGKLNLGKTAGLKKGERLVLNVGFDFSPIPFTHIHFEGTKSKITRSLGLKNFIKVRPFY